MKKVNLKSILASVSFSLFFLNSANAGILDGCFGGGVYKKVSKEAVAERLPKVRWEKGGICYDSALCISMAEKTLTQDEANVVKSLIRNNTPKGTTNYPAQYLEVMNINERNTYSAVTAGESNTPNTLSLNDITESGFLNFKKTNDGYGHTAYVQVSKDGEKYLYNTNQTQLDQAMLRSGQEPFMVNGPVRAFRWRLTEDGFNSFLSGEIDRLENPSLPEDFHWEFNYTPFERVKTNVAHGTNG
ncbi:hypothetical protein ACFFK7_18335 [Pseudoalteromonas xiamenensis]|uniref:hypothetical protein n=1 Tax=Pseudoalteromonas xiamenensis TaxID=882626 RepID=UPI0035EABDAA